MTTTASLRLRISSVVANIRSLSDPWLLLTSVAPDAAIFPFYFFSHIFFYVSQSRSQNSLSLTQMLSVDTSNEEQIRSIRYF